MSGLYGDWDRITDHALDRRIPDASDASDSLDGFPQGGVDILSETVEWLQRYIRVTADGDLDILALWIAHTHVIDHVYTTPRLLIDSALPGAGKTTVLEHIQRLAFRPMQAASLSSPALLARIMDQGVRTICIDEADRNLDPKREGVGELLAVLNSGYKRGATRPVLVPSKGGNWDVSEMATFAPVVMAGNQPRLPDDTRSRVIRVLLMPDLDGTVEESDWENIEPDALAIHAKLEEWADANRDTVRVAQGALPPEVKGRARERWKPLAKVAEAVGHSWPERTAVAAVADVAEAEHEQEDGMRQSKPEIVLLADIAKVWPPNTPFLSSELLAASLATTYPRMWGDGSGFGRALTTQRMGRMLSKAYKVYSSKNAADVRGYPHTMLSTVWRRMGVPTPGEPSNTSQPSEPSDLWRDES